MSRFHSLKVKEVRPETESCVSIAFDVPEELKKKRMLLSLNQHLTLKVNLEGEEVRRSILSAPHRKTMTSGLQLNGWKVESLALLRISPLQQEEKWM
ncbi:MAG: hypothetical protein R2769_01750 [Saprospiraceae bacterium]